MPSSSRDPRLSASLLLSRNHSVTSLHSDTPSFHTAHGHMPIDMEEREKFMRSSSPLHRSNTPTSIPVRTSSQISRSNTPVNRTKNASPIPRAISPIPAHLRRSPTPTNLGIVTRSPSKKSHTPFPYTVSQKMERQDSGFEDGPEGRISPSIKGRRSPLSAEQKEKVREMEKSGDKIKTRRSSGSGGSSRAGSRPASSRRSSTRSSPTSSNTTATGNGNRTSSTSLRNSASISRRPPHARSLSYQTSPTNQKPRFNTHNSAPLNQLRTLDSRPTPEVQECRLSNLRQRHCFYQFPPLPSSPPSTAHASSSSRKGSTSGIFDDYTIPPPNHPYHRYDLDTKTSPRFTHSIDIPNRQTQTASPALSLPPQTTLYFLTPETRRLEYAAIDAASQGIRGFVSKLVPDCMLPKPSRGGFHDDEDSEGDGGSVRRYRLPDDHGVAEEFEMGKERERGWGKEGKRGGGWRRWVPGLRNRGRR